MAAGAFTTCRFANIAEEDESMICNRQRKVSLVTSIVVACNNMNILSNKIKKSYCDILDIVVMLDIS